MRILRLAVDPEHLVDLHPACSIVAGLDGEQARALRRAFAAIAAGLDPQVPGVVEAHGILLGTGQRDLGLLDLGADPVRSVATQATLAADASELPEPVRAAESDVLACAAERHRAALALRAAQVAPTATDRDLSRAEQLRTAIARHEHTAAEPLRVALDELRDRMASAPAGGPDVDGTARALRARLTAVGVDLGPHEPVGALGADEVRRVAEDWLDEHRRQGAWAVGARVELDGIERRVRRSSAEAGGPLPDSPARRLARATVTLTRALDRADEVREDGSSGDLPGLPPLPALEAALRARIDGHRPSRVAGSAPLLLVGVLDDVDPDGLGPLLDRLVDHGAGVQLVVVDDRPEAAAWAREAGHRRAAPVTPAPGHVG